MNTIFPIVLALAFLAPSARAQGSAIDALASSDPESTVTPPAKVRAPEPPKKAEELPAEMIPLVTPPVPLPEIDKEIFSREYPLVAKGHVKTIKALAAYMAGTAAQFDLPGVLYDLGAHAVKPLNWDERKYVYPEGVSEYAKASIRHIIWWREWNYWWDKLQSKEFKPTFEKAIMIKYRKDPGRKQAEYEFQRLAGMYLWYSEIIGDENEALMKKMTAAGDW